MWPLKENLIGDLYRKGVLIEKGRICLSVQEEIKKITSSGKYKTHEFVKELRLASN